MKIKLLKLSIVTIVYAYFLYLCFGVIGSGLLSKRIEKIYEKIEKNTCRKINSVKQCKYKGDLK